MAQSLWLTRRNGKVRGPYPAPVIVQYLILGRLTPEDEVSLDGHAWFSIRDSGYFRSTLDALPGGESQPAAAADWNEERDLARRRWLDERQEVDSLPGTAEEHRSGEPAGQAVLRHDHQETQALVKAARCTKPTFLAALLALLILLAIGWAVLQGQREQPELEPHLLGVPDCQAAPADNVVWRGCDKRNALLGRASLANARMHEVRLDSADLRGARLSYADLTQASLRGADLSGANLTGADLSGADLTGANLGGANLEYATLVRARLDGTRLEGAALGKAAWQDGRVCAVGSVGGCG